MKSTIFRERLEAIDAKAALYGTADGSRDFILDFQLKSLNSAWREAQHKFRFYRRFKVANSLPDSFRSLEEFSQAPTMTKEALQASSAEILADSGSSRHFQTGGSSGQPLQIPYSPREVVDRYALSYYFREEVGLRPFDPYLHIWGHSHLFGAGALRPVRLAKRALADRFARGHRVSANVLTEESLSNMVEALSRHNFRYIIGYSGAVLALADYILQRKVPARWTRLRRVIVTAENCYPGELDRIRTAFRRPVLQEYGAAETGVIAHTGLRASSEYSVGWSDVLVEAKHDNSILVSTLSPRSFPLFRYELGDLISKPHAEGTSILSFKSIEGRVVDVAEVPQLDGGHLPMRASTLVQCFRGLPGIDTVQFDNHDDRTLTLFYHSRSELDAARVESSVTANLLREFPNVASDRVTFVRLDEPSRTRAGKRTIRRPRSA